MESAEATAELVIVAAGVLAPPLAGAVLWASLRARESLGSPKCGRR